MEHLHTEEVTDIVTWEVIRRFEVPDTFRSEGWAVRTKHFQ